MTNNLVPHPALSTLAKSKALGECVSVHPGEAFSRVHGVYMLIIGALLTIAELTDGAGVGKPPEIPGGVWATLALTAAGALYLLLVMQQRGRLLQIHQNGIACRSGGDIALHWTEITGIFCSAIVSDTDGTYGHVELTTERGATHKLSSFEGMGRIIDAVNRKTLPHLLNAAITRIANGESIRFGKLVLSAQGITAQGITKEGVFKSWSEVKSVWKTTEDFTVTLRRQKEPWIKVMPHKVTNYALLVVLAKTLYENAR